MTRGPDVLARGHRGPLILGVVPNGTTRWLVRFGYDGRPFDGWARQPGRSTVEGTLDRAIAHHRLSLSRAPFAVASRTDRGVSAAGNAMIIESELPGPIVLRSLNGLSPAVFFTQATAVDLTFRVRGAIRRVYRYFESRPPSHPDRWNEAARLFSGQIDVRSFGKGIPVDRPQWRDVESVSLQSEPAGSWIEVQAPSFVWGMVRKIVGALREIDSGRLELDTLTQALTGRRRLTLPMAEPEPLVLWDVEYGNSWEHRWAGPNRHQARWWEQQRREAAARGRVLTALASGFPR